MNLNDIQLTPHLMAGLYANSLVESDATSVPEAQIPASILKHLGNNRKSVTVVIRNEKIAFLDDEELALLTGILAACQLSLADVAVINTHGAATEKIAVTIEQLQPKQLLLFGVPPTEIGLPINFPAFQVQSFNNRTYLYSPPFNELMNSREEKKKLWTGLKKIFNT